MSPVSNKEPTQESDARSPAEPRLFVSRQAPRTGGEIARDIAIECHDVCGPETVEDREQQQRVFGRLSERFSLFEQQTRPLHGRFGFRRSPSFDVDERVDECDLKLDLLRRSAGVLGKVAIWSRARVNCSTASTSAERCSDRCPALPHRPTAFSICPASVQ